MTTEEYNELDLLLNKVVNSCLARWNSDDERTKFFCDHFKEWLQQMPEDMKPIVLELLDEFDYYSQEYVNESFVSLHQRLQEFEEVNFDNTVYSILKKQSATINSAYEYFPEYRRLNGISQHVMIPDIKDLNVDQLSAIENIVFVDDFCGSGKTMTDYLDTIITLVEGKRIFYIIVQIMEDAVCQLQKWSDEHRIKIITLPIVCKKKAFIRTESLHHKKQIFVDKSKILGIKKENILGFKETESITAFYNNTPNNTLGIFWQSKVHGIFPRKDEERPRWKSLNKREKNRNTSNYLNKYREL